ncbi:MAG TPA: thioredoxin domain-containing protein [Gemmatimonadaceae bacterium]
MKIREFILNSVTAVTAACAIILTVHTLRGGGTATNSYSFAPRALQADEWRPLLTSGHFIGSSSAKLTVIEFGDFQCPVCGAYERVLDSMRTRYPNDFAVSFHQFPLAYHPLAYPLARASECAATQGKFTKFHDFVYAHQSLLGLVSIADLGSRVGLPDTLRFKACAMDTEPVPAIERDVVAGKLIGIPGTPAIIVNGTLHTADLSVHGLEQILAKAKR